MKTNRRKKRELDVIDNSLHLCNILLADLSKPFQPEEAVSYLRIMATNIMRLCKAREQIGQIKPINDDVVQAKTEAITAIDDVLENILDIAVKSYQVIKESAKV